MSGRAKPEEKPKHPARGVYLAPTPRQTPTPNIVRRRGKIYGLVAPGYEMAEAVANGIVGEEQPFTGADMSTKLKLMGVDVASFGRYSGFKVFFFFYFLFHCCFCRLPHWPTSSTTTS